MAQLIAEFGFPIVAMVGLGYFVYYVWRTMINVIGPAIKQMHFALIKLIDQIRMLDNDMIRMNMKLAMVLEHRHLLEQKLSPEEVGELDEIINRYQSRNNAFDSTGKASGGSDEPKK